MLLIPLLIERVCRLFTKKATRIRGRLHFEVYNADGSFDRAFDWDNGDTTAGVNNMLDVYFNSGTQTTAWYLGLIDNAGFSAVAASDTMSSHSGWNESVAYTAATRPQWTSGAASGLAVTNAVTVDFTMNATTTLKGIFLTSNSTKSGTTGTLFSTATGTAQTFSSGQVVKVTYTKSATLS